MGSAKREGRIPPTPCNLESWLVVMGGTMHLTTPLVDSLHIRESAQAQLRYWLVLLSGQG